MADAWGCRIRIRRRYPLPDVYCGRPAAMRIEAGCVHEHMFELENQAICRDHLLMLETGHIRCGDCADAGTDAHHCAVTHWRVLEEVKTE